MSVGGREEEEVGRQERCSTKNKNPTRQCGEQRITNGQNMFKHVEPM